MRVKWDEKISYGGDWQQKGLWHDPTKLDNTLSQNIQNIQWSHKAYEENHSNLKSGIDNRRKSLAKVKIQKYIPGRCATTIAICNSDDATQPHTQEMQIQIQT